MGVPGAAQLLLTDFMEITDGDGPRVVEVGKYTTCLLKKRKRTLE